MLDNAVGSKMVQYHQERRPCALRLVVLSERNIECEHIMGGSAVVLARCAWVRTCGMLRTERCRYCNRN